MSKLFKKSSSKGNVSDTSPAPDVPVDDEKGDSPQTLTTTTDGPAPEYPDSLKEAWTAAHREFPRPQGAEKLLNEIGMSIIHSHIHTSPSCDDRRCVPSIQY